MRRTYASDDSLPAQESGPVPKHAAATYWRTALRLAALRSIAVVTALLALAVAGVFLLLELPPVLAGPVPGGAVAALTLVLLTFSASLWHYTDHIVRANWKPPAPSFPVRHPRRAVASSPPARNITLRTRRGPVQSVMVDLPPNSEPDSPLVSGFGVSAADLVSFLFEVEQGRGLQERNWTGPGTRQHVLPSGQRVTQPLFRHLLRGLDRAGMARKASGRWELVVDPETVARRLSRLTAPPPDGSGRSARP